MPSRIFYMQSHVLVLSIEEIIENFNTHCLFKQPILQLFMLVQSFIFNICYGYVYPMYMFLNQKINYW